ncbi:MAG: deoxyguanosinetriphosphate triphosphohydrolase [Nitrospirae bacterium]|nr:deoxyguanosinetriphosphate triphosphohydrolase [Nitrospirota bacterium]MCL5977642.1 deoxyguanosinetriphosphate triphosphohydrolase [Nitrospirota bacterium]
MTIREQTEDIEKQILHPNACLSSKSKGRARPEKEDNLRTCFQRDRDRIIHSKAFRRLKHKTQVFLAPKGDHYRTRLTHVLEVSQIARTIARALRLNEDLTEAIALGHDLGHTPFGHAGEAILRELHPGGFDHYKQSLRVVDFIEKNGLGLNLTKEVRDGIVKHSKGKGLILSDNPKDKPATLEGMVVRVSDIIAYVNHDLDDALRAEVIKKSDLPREIIKVIGEVYSNRIDVMVRDVIKASLEAGIKDIGMGEEMSMAVYKLRDFLFERVYESERIRNEFNKAKGILKALYEYYLEHIDELVKDVPSEKRLDRHRMVCDFIAGMTDSFAFITYERLFLPEQWKVL